MPSSRNPILRRVLAALWLTAGVAAAASLPAISPARLHQDAAVMEKLVAACAVDAAACDANKVAEDSQLGDPHKTGGYTQHWFWLRTALEAAHKAKPQDRASSMKEASARLEELDREIDVPPAKPPLESAARQRTDAILAGPEFQSVKGTSWLDRMASRFWEAVGRLFQGANKLGSSSPWLASLLEWGFFLTAAAGLAFVLLRAVARQRLQVKLASGAPGHASHWDRESVDWAHHAAGRAAAEDWREAIHALYWAAILHLEANRAWRHDPSRTPREYVRLLQPGSAQREALAGLTRLFERTWYGLKNSNAVEYREASALYERLTANGAATAASPGRTVIAEGAA